MDQSLQYGYIYKKNMYILIKRKNYIHHKAFKK